MQLSNKIIVTGGAGYIGSHTVVELLNNNYDVVIIDDFSNASLDTIVRISQITGKRPIVVKADLKEREIVMESFKLHSDAQAVIHFAAYKAVGESVHSPLKYYRNNLCSLINVLDGQISNGINNIIFSSSATVYGTPDQLPIREDNPTKRPFSPYGNSKKVSEEIIEDLIKSNSSISAIMLRYFNPIGAHDSGLIGELPTGIPNNLLPYITQTAIGLREKLLVFGNDYQTKDGTPLRDYVHVVDLARAHIKALERIVNSEQEHPFECFNLGTGVGYSVLDIIKTFEKISGVSLNYEITERRDGDLPELLASVQHAKRNLNWEASMHLEQMIKSSWDWELHFRELENK
jgi:UDP-glucose 4-epimerase